MVPTKNPHARSAGVPCVMGSTQDMCSANTMGLAVCHGTCAKRVPSAGRWDRLKPRERHKAMGSAQTMTPMQDARLARIIGSGASHVASAWGMGSAQADWYMPWGTPSGRRAPWDRLATCVRRNTNGFATTGTCNGIGA